MTRDMKKLLRELALPEGCPAVDAKAVKRRVNAALNTDLLERKAYMKQKAKMAAMLVAAAVVLTGTALAVASNVDVLQLFFKGDTSSTQGLVDVKPRSVSSKDFRFTVESSATDGQNIYLAVRVDALNDTAVDTLMSNGFGAMDAFHFYPVDDPDMAPPEDIYFAKTSGIYIPGVAPVPIRGRGITEREDAKTDTSRTWMIDVSLPEGTVASTLRARLCYMEADQFVEVPLTPANSITVKIGASGESAPTSYSQSGRPLTIERVTLTPLTCRVEVTTDSSLDYEPRISFRMKDGTLYTQSQMMASTVGHGDGSTASYSYRFHKVLDLTQLSALVVFDREYPLDGSSSLPTGLLLHK